MHSRFRKTQLFLAISILIISSLACDFNINTGDGNEGGNGEREPTSEDSGKGGNGPDLAATQQSISTTQTAVASSSQPTQPQPPTQANENEITFYIENQQNVAICYVYISLATDSSWSTDWLGSSEIGIGDFEWFTVAPGIYDIKLEDCSYNELDVFMGETLDSAFQASGYVSYASTIPLVSFYIENQSSDTICYVYISLSTEGWGSDWLGTDVIVSGDFTWFETAPGNYDIMVEDCAQNLIENIYGVDIELYDGDGFVITGTGQSSSGVTIYIENQHSVSICYVYISLSSSADWGSDWLGSDIIVSGDSYFFVVSPGEYDIKVEDCSETELEIFLSAIIDKFTLGFISSP